jgi:hypothetical protein
MRHVFLSGLFTSLGLLVAILNRLTHNTLPVASVAMQYDAAIDSVQLALHLQEVRP